jgi:iron complex outermembrane receptor protein
LRRGSALALVLGWLLCAAPDSAPADGAAASDFALYETESTRSPSRVIETPAAISVVIDQEIERARPAVALDEALELVPGAFAQGGRNFAQDTRVSIRGYGARAQFGVRGVRMLVDGVPTTLADGQSEVDSIDPAFIERIDVVRSQVSSLWGGSGGGLIAIDTLSPTDEPAYAARVLFGSDHLSRYVLTATGKAAGNGYALGLARTRATGYRDHARAEQNTVLAKVERELESGTQLRAIFTSVYSPEGQDPGGLTQAEVDAERTRANPSNVRFDADEAVEQYKASLHLRQPLGPDNDLNAMVYGLVRDFENLLPGSPVANGRQVAFDRGAGGARLSWNSWLGPLRWATGVDLDVQMDHRKNWVNLPGGVQGDLLLDQSETVRSFGAWARTELDLGHGFDVIGGLRWDWVEFLVGDRFVANPATDDASDRLRFRELSPSIGLHWGRTTALQLYANVGSAFQVPTTTELADIDASGVLVGGFDDDFDPERTLGFEVGAKGLLSDRLAYDVALFDLRLRDVPVADEVVPGTLDFRAAGKVRRRGVEVGCTYVFTPELDLRLGYTYADYWYRDYRFEDQIGGSAVTVSNGGNREPNVPQHNLGAELRWAHHSGVFATLSLRHFSDIDVDDANLFEADGATLSDFRLGYDWRGEKLQLQPFAGVRNWSRAEYDQTLRPNAAANRFYEPAPLAELYVGLDVRFQ